MKAMNQAMRLVIGAMALLALGACDKMSGTSDAAASVTQKAFYNARDTWTDVFTYHPKALPQQPQTRYCYQMQSDITCYDSAQPTQTSKLVGYQDGEAISWVQPGGGSLGASGGAPVSLKNTQVSSATIYVPPSLAEPAPAAAVGTIEVPRSGSIRATNLPPSPTR